MIKKILIVFGTRPEAIKMAPVYLALKKEPDNFDVSLCVTAQHREMLDQVLEVFDIIPDYDLDIMKAGQDLFDVTAKTLILFRDILKEVNPDIVMVHGDTTTTFASATACFYSGIKVWHVEAGLRTFDIHAPFPEEFNRQIVSKVADIHLAPTVSARDNLLKEGTDEGRVIVTGNTVIDSLFFVLERIESCKVREQKVRNILNEYLSFSWKLERFILINGHRRENFGEGFKNICRALAKLARRYPEIQFVYPVHLNPNVQAPVSEMLTNIDNLHLIPPLNYEPFAYLLKYSYLIVTDSGGIQEEAPSLGKPVVVLRDSTERPEAVIAGTVVLSGSSEDKIIAHISELLDDQNKYNAMAISHNPYGDGKACEKIVQALRISKCS